MDCEMTKIIGEFEHPKHGKYYLWYNTETGLYNISRLLTIPPHCAYRSIGDCLEVKGLT